ncbi:MAG TPA: endonuclease domain-containing protein [Thermodesulfobacteriota bacterium]|nr:endonuclease domain-containing protein [Thermodesulfobacteriota bacterium]
MKRRTIIPYNPKLKELARKLRKNSTLSEIFLWQHLKGKQMLGYDFHRQKPIDDYIVDFFCSKLMLAVEIDGVSHDSEKVYIRDMTREQRLESLGVRFLRFDDREVKKDVNSVLQSIESWILEYEKKHGK